MASITNKTNLFFVTSPRTPAKMKEEIRLLVDDFTGKIWPGNRSLQAKYFLQLAKSEFYQTTQSIEELEARSEASLSQAGRDRVTRGPKSYGFVNLDPIALTPAGDAYINGPRPHEAFTRQIVKFQMPSPHPYHVDKGKTYSIKPYLEMLRLIQETGSLSKDEIAAFVMPMVHVNMYSDIKQRILDFRKLLVEADRSKTNYSRLYDKAYTEEIKRCYAEQIQKKNFSTRESATETLKEFAKKKKETHRDYADAAFRWLRETNLVTIRSSRSTRLRIPVEKVREVEYILEGTNRAPVFTDDRKAYESYLYASDTPKLLTDDAGNLIADIAALPDSPKVEDLQELSLQALKATKDSLIAAKVEATMQAQIEALEAYDDYDDIVSLYDDIVGRNVIDRPLMMEWNTWRAFVMLDDGKVEGAFNVDSAGMPLSTAPGNTADITCRYNNFDMTVEVTLSAGQRQAYMEMEPVPRHLGRLANESEKETYCIFVAQRLHEATLAHFFTLRRTNISMYGGEAKIVPLELDDFRVMLKKAKEAENRPTAKSIERFVTKASALTLEAQTPKKWYDQVAALARDWI